MAIICDKCGECFEWSYRHKHKCPTNEAQVNKSLFAGSVKDFIDISESSEMRDLVKEISIIKKKQPRTLKGLAKRYPNKSYQQIFGWSD